MNTQTLSRDLLARTELPATQLAKLSFCASNRVAKVAAWVDSLHATQISHTSVQLYKALPEINQLKTSPENRLAMLETVRPTTQNIIKGLTEELLQHYHGSLDEKKKSAIVALSLQKSLLDGYTRCVHEFCSSKKLSAAAASLLTCAIHRSITGIGLIFLRRYQLYTQPPNGLWLRLHSLFQIAEHFDFLAQPVLDPLLIHAQAINIQCAYVRVLLMPTAKLNQLSKHDAQAIYDSFENLSASVKLLSSNSDDNFYAVALNSDYPPLYKNRLPKAMSGRIIDISFHSLVTQLSTQQNSLHDNTAQPRQHGPYALGPTLANHLIECWSQIAERKQKRTKVQSAAEVCIGLVDCHQLIGGGLNFDDFNRMGGLHSTESALNLFPNDRSTRRGATQGKEVDTYAVTIQNQSAGGFCLLWNGDQPIRLDAGEFLGIKTLGRRTWNLCVVRWIRQLNRGTQLGVQLLSQSPIAAGAAQEYDMGGHSDYMRVFLCTSNAPGEALSIITPTKPFNENERLKLYDGDGVYSIRLDNCFFSTSIAKQFHYTPTENSHSGQPGGCQRPSSNTRRSCNDSWD